MRRKLPLKRHPLVWLMTIALLLIPQSLFAQGTNIDAPDNKYSISDDVRLGREAAAEVERRMPILSEGGDVDDYLERLGQRLVRIGVTPQDESFRTIARPQCLGGITECRAPQCRHTGSVDKMKTPGTTIIKAGRRTTGAAAR